MTEIVKLYLAQDALIILEKGSELMKAWDVVARLDPPNDLNTLVTESIEHIVQALEEVLHD